MSLNILQSLRFPWRWSFHGCKRAQTGHCPLNPSSQARAVSTKSESKSHLERIRNIGIIAHIDAGKTTTTERMLYYSGLTRRIGDVDEGSTVTDFLPAERARGITIQSAAVTFKWPPIAESGADDTFDSLPLSQISHTVNLIDTPGHADFTFEVLRSLRVLDGAICILDGVAGVEAQTEKVWMQANKYSIPRIIFVNKLDRDGAAFGAAVRAVRARLRGVPAVCQIPLWEDGKGKFSGVVDIINLCGLRWPSAGDGKSIQRFSLPELIASNPALAIEVPKARAALIESLCEFDEHLLSVWLEHNDDSMAIPPQEIRDSLRRCILDGSGRLIPIFAGASFRNIGVQPLLDTVNDLLPSPAERPDSEISLGSVKSTLSDLIEGRLRLPEPEKRYLSKRLDASMAMVRALEGCALAFKVVNDPRRGTLVYIRVYHGTIKRNSALWNTNLHVTEKAQRLLQMYASDADEVSEINEGQIGVILGLKYARTGDTLISYPGVNPKNGPPAPLNGLQLRPIEIPPPVFFTAVEPQSLSEEKNVADTLALMLREDPSLHVSIDEESGQMLLSGMGELHLEIARDRLIKEYKAKATMGTIEIGYRESVISQNFVKYYLFDRDIAGKRGKAGCTAVLQPHGDETRLGPMAERDGNSISLQIATNIDDEGAKLSNGLFLEEVRMALINGAAAALARGPRRAFPMHACHVMLKFSIMQDTFGTESTVSAISSAARLAVQGALKDALAVGDISLMEPVMNVIITCDESSLGAIVHDLSSARGGHIVSLDDSEDTNSEETETPTIGSEQIYAPPDPFETTGTTDYASVERGRQRYIRARVPLKEMVGYLKHLRSMTAGRGTFEMSVDRFERITGPREKLV